MEKITIEIAVDHEDADGFANWLTLEGYDASVGTSTGNYVDGVCTSANTNSNETFNGLWDSYCRG